MVRPAKICLTVGGVIVDWRRERRHVARSSPKRPVGAARARPPATAPDAVVAHGVILLGYRTEPGDGHQPAIASYHLRQLHAAGVIELEEVRARRGGRERRFRYRPGARASTSDATTNQDDHASLGEAICVELQRRVRHAGKGATRLGVDAELWVVPADWQKALDGFKAASNALHEWARPPTARVRSESASAPSFSP